MSEGTMGNRIRLLREEHGWSQADLAERLGKAQRTVSLWEEKGTSRTENLERLCEVLHTTEQYLRSGVGEMKTQRVPLLGLVGAGDVITMLPQDAIDYVDAPPRAEGQYAALEVSGTSMSPVFRPGQVVYYRTDLAYNPADYIGETCIVKTAAGEIYLKRLFHGPRPGTYTLVSHNGEPISEVEITRCAPVEWVRFRSR